jgi:Mn-containing catalase
MALAVCVLHQHEATRLNVAHLSVGYIFLATNRDAVPPPAGRWSEGPSLDGKGTFSVRQNEPLGEEPVLGPARPDSGAQREQMGLV